VLVFKKRRYCPKKCVNFSDNTFFSLFGAISSHIHIEGYEKKQMDVREIQTQEMENTKTKMNGRRVEPKPVIRF